MYKRQRYLTAYSFDTNLSGFAGSWVFLRLHQLHAGLRGTHVSWSAFPAPDCTLICESENLNNKCSGMANCLESTQGSEEQ